MAKLLSVHEMNALLEQFQGEITAPGSVSSDPNAAPLSEEKLRLIAFLHAKQLSAQPKNVLSEALPKTTVHHSQQSVVETDC